MHNVLVALGLVLVERTASLEQRLVGTSTTCNDTNGCTAASRDRLLSTGGKTDTSLVLVGGVANHGGIVA